MQRDVKIGLGVAVVGLAVFAAIRFGSGPAAKTGLDLALGNLPPGWSATHGAVTYDALSGNARVDNLVVTHDDQIIFSAGAVLASGITGISPASPPKRIAHITIKDAAGTAVLRHIGRLELDGVEIESFRKILDPASYPGGKPVSDAKLPLIGRVDGDDVVVHVDVPKRPGKPDGAAPGSADVRVGEWHITGLNGRQLPVPPPPPPPGEQYWKFIAGVLREAGFGSQVAKNITDTIPGAGELRIGSEEVTGVQDGRVHSVQVQDVSFIKNEPSDNPRGLGPFRFTLDRTALTDIDLNPVIDALPALMSPPPGDTGKPAVSPRLNGLEISGLRWDAAKSALVSMASFNGNAHYAPDGSQAGTVAMRALKVVFTGRDVSPQTSLSLQRFGMSDFNVDVDEAGSFTPQDGHTKLTQADFIFHGLGALRIKADMSGLNSGSAPALDQLAMLRAVRLYSASIQWDDASLTDRVFHLLSLQQGKSVEALRAQLSIPLMSLGFMMPEQPDAGAQVNAFLDGKHRLIVTLAPPHPPVSMGDVASAAAAEKAVLLGVMIKGD